MKAFQCMKCDSGYSRQSRLNEHMKKAHGDISQQKLQRFICPFKCSQKYGTVVELLQHCEREHKENLGKCKHTDAYTQYAPYSSKIILLLGSQQHEFNSFTEFKQWKEHEEERTHTTYIRDDRVYHPKSSGEGIYIVQKINTYRYLFVSHMHACK